MSVNGISSLDIYKKHELSDSGGDKITVFGLDKEITGKLYDYFLGNCRKFTERKPYASFSMASVQHVFQLSCDHLHRSVNYHDYSDHADETKYFTRICFYWLKNKPISITETEGVPTGDRFEINESFIALLIFSYIYAVLNKNATIVGLHEFIKKHQDNIINLRYHLQKHTITLNGFEAYIDGLVGFVKS